MINIHTEADSSVKDYDDYRCDVCNRKISSGEKLRQFYNNMVEEFFIDSGRKSIVEVKRFHTIQNEHFIKVCEKCFMPKIYSER